MKYLAAYMLLALGGNESPSAEDVKALLSTAGTEVDDKDLEFLMEKVAGKSLEELEAEGKERLLSIGGGSGGGGGGGGGGGDGGEAAEEEKVEEEEEEVDLGGGGMFGDEAAY